MAERSEPISFRLASTFAKQLADRASEAGESSGEHARRLLVDVLNDTYRERLTRQLDEIRGAIAGNEQTLARLRGDVATSVAALIKYLSPALPEDKRMTAQQIEEWVRSRFT